MRSIKFVNLNDAYLFQSKKRVGAFSYIELEEAAAVRFDHGNPTCMMKKLKQSLFWVNKILLIDR